MSSPARIITAAATVLVALAGAAPALASTVSVAPAGAENPVTTLTYSADPGEGNDLTVALSADASAWLVTDPGAAVTAGAGCTSVDAHTASCPIGSAQDGIAVEADLADMNDSATMTGACGAEENAACRDVSVDLGPGDDVASGADGTPNGRTMLHGGPGDDRLTAGTSGAWLSGGRGDDVLTGRSGDDDLEGNPGHDVIRGKSGTDMVRGGWGDDVVEGGYGNDVVAGGPGRDLLRGGHGDDSFLAGNDGADLIYGGRGFDQAHLQRHLDHWWSIERLR